MKEKTIRILVSIAGHAEALYNLPEFSFQPGEIVTVHEELAAAWIQSGIAEAAPKKKDK